MIILSTSAAWAQSKDKFDATSVKLRNMETGITEILERTTKSEIKVDRSNLAEELQSNILELRTAMSEIQQKMLRLSTETSGEIDDISTQTSTLRDNQKTLESIIPNLETRLANVEETLGPIEGARRVVKDDDGSTSAKIFKIGTLGSLIDALPSSENCSEVGNILSTYTDRSYNTVFVKSEIGVVDGCSYEAGRWQVSAGNDFLLGHVVTME